MPRQRKNKIQDASLLQQLSRRERQVMDVIFGLGQATANDIMERLPGSPSNSTVRMLLRILEEKGHLVHRKDGRQFVYTSTLSPEKAKSSAIRHLVKTFFGGSTIQAVTALIDQADQSLSDQEIRELREIIEQSKQEGR